MKPMQDEIAEAMARMGIPATMESLDSTNGSGSAKPEPLATARTVLRLDLVENAEWRQKFVKIDETHHEKTATLARWGEWFIRRSSLNIRDKGHQLVICGNPGTGKSHVGRRVVAFIESYGIDLWREKHWPRPPKAALVDWARLCERDKPESFDDALYDIATADVVVLDDVGSESDRFKSQQNVSRLRRALEACEHKWLMVNANFRKVDWTDKLDARVSDRLEAMHYLEMTGVPSYRPKLRRAA